MFVPSLSWQNDRFRIKMAQKCRFSQDCDNRDERFGWTGDSALTADEASVNFDLSSFYDSWARMLDDSSQNGAVSSWVPGGPGHSSPPAGGSADASWGSAFPSVVYAQFKWQGDTVGPLARWKGVTRFIDNEYSRTTDPTKGGIK
jgi:alpha-L-rhamnosidase